MSAPSLPGSALERIRSHLVGLKMSRALEVDIEDSYLPGLDKFPLPA